MQFYTGDWQKSADVQSLPYSERGIWFEMLCFMHNSPQRGELVHSTGKAMADDEVARLLGLTKQDFTNSLALLLRTGVTERNEDGALINRRMVREREKKEAKSRAGKIGASVKHHGTDLTDPVTYIEHLYDSDSELCNWRSGTDQEREKFKVTWSEWQAYRQSRGDAVKDWTRMWRKQLHFLARYPIGVAVEIIEQSIRNNWQGLFAPKAQMSLGIPVNPTSVPVFAQIKAVESQIAEIDKQLKAIPDIAPSVFPERAAEEEKKRKPLREEKARLNEKLRALRGQQSK